MSIQGYQTVSSRNLIRAAQGMLEHAQPITVLGDFGTVREMPKNSTDTLVFRRTLPFGANTTGVTIENSQRYVGSPNISPANFQLAEGTTPTASTITFQDVSVTLQNWGVLYKFSSKTEMLYEDDIPGEMVKHCGETLAEVTELVRYGVLKAGSQVIYTNGASRSTVNTAITLNALRKAVRVLESNRAKRVTQRVAAGVNYLTRAVQPAYLVFVHTDMEADIRNLAGFTKVEEYGSFKPVHDREIGAVEQFRFITSPLFTPFTGAGSATLNGMVTQGGTNVDVYPTLLVAEGAWGQVALKGMNAINPSIIPSTQKSHANPLGMYGFVGAQTWFNCVRLNEAWMVRIESGATSL